MSQAGGRVYEKYHAKTNIKHTTAVRNFRNTRKTTRGVTARKYTQQYYYKNRLLYQRL